jgi:hypothetical protein
MDTFLWFLGSSCHVAPWQFCELGRLFCLFELEELNLAMAAADNPLS